MMKMIKYRYLYLISYMPLQEPCQENDTLSLFRPLGDQKIVCL